MEKLYRYETHMHTSEVSACADSTAAEMADMYKKAGYTGIIVTDHFFNGNTCIDRSLPWDEWVEGYCSGYEHAKARGDEIGLDVFFGIEYGDGGSDYLIYGLDKDWLLSYPDMMSLSIPDFLELVHKCGGMVIQAHPFRESWYIRGTMHCPTLCDAVEIYNASHADPAPNERAAIYAGWYGLPGTGGSDAHNTTDRWYGGGVDSPKRFTSALDYAKAAAAGEITVLMPPAGDNNADHKYY
ncbi:MAG: PHP domain-containing protein [Oscillospiraceae bacterium]|nr:PHP domain-containing protein [Oscillospiraceae bacterium]